MFLLFPLQSGKCGAWVSVIFFAPIFVRVFPPTHITNVWSDFAGLMFFWGGWLLVEYPSSFSYLEYNIAMYSLFFSLYGLTIATQGAVDRKKANLAAARIFDLIDRQSEIDPLSKTGKFLS